MSKRIPFVTLSSVLIAVLSACSSEKSVAPVMPESVSNLAVVSVQKATGPEYVESSGTVRAAESAKLSAQVLGAVVGVTVHEGDQVRRGQVVVTLDDRQFRAATERALAAVTGSDEEIAAAEANYNLADATAKRYENLFNKRSVSPQEFDEVKARYQAAQAQLEITRARQAQAQAALSEARTLQGYTRLVAPFDGVVTERRVEVGTLASPGMPLLTIENTGRYRLEANINERDIAFVTVGMNAPVTIESLSPEPIQCKVVQIVPAADPSSRSFVVKLELPPLPTLRSGLFGRVSIAKGPRNMLLIPRTAVLDRGQLQAVYVIDSNDMASLRYVTLGHEHANTIEVLSGVDSGERLVADPGPRDLSGKLVKQ